MSKRSFISIFAAVSILALATLACSISIPFRSESVTPSGNIITETRTVSAFDRIEVSTIGEMTIIQGKTESLVIEADDSIMPYIETNVSGNKLTIGFKDNVSLNFNLNGTSPTLNYTLTVKDLTSLSISGLASVDCHSLETNDLSILISGGGNVDIDSLMTDILSVDISGLGDVTLDGQVNSQDVNISGAGSYQGGDLMSATASVNLSGLGDATMWVTDNLDVFISGAGSVNYYGSPSISQDISGLGDLNSLGEH